MKKCIRQKIHHNLKIQQAINTPLSLSLINVDFSKDRVTSLRFKPSKHAIFSSLFNVWDFTRTQITHKKHKTLLLLILKSIFWNTIEPILEIKLHTIRQN